MVKGSGTGGARGDARALTAVLEALIDQPDLDAAAIAAETHLSQRAVDHALWQLADLGVVRPLPGRDRGWHFTHPQQALELKALEASRQLTAQIDGIVSVRATLNDLAEVFAPHGAWSGQKQGVSVLHHHEDVNTLLTEFIDRVEDEVCAFVTREPSPESAAVGLENDALLISRGVTLRTIVLEAFYRDTRVSSDLQQLAAIGTHLRTRPTLPTRMILLDRTKAIVAIDPDDDHRGAIFIEHPGILRLVHELFELHWADASPVLSTRAEASLEGPRPMDVAVLNLLALGHKDDAIARSIGQSTRTVRRIISTMSERLGARSRFDLALRAQSHGWFSNPFD